MLQLCIFSLVLHKNIFTLPIKREKKISTIWPCLPLLTWDLGVHLGLCSSQVPLWTFHSSAMSGPTCGQCLVPTGYCHLLCAEAIIYFIGPPQEGGRPVRSLHCDFDILGIFSRQATGWLGFLPSGSSLRFGSRRTSSTGWALGSSGADNGEAVGSVGIDPRESWPGLMRSSLSNSAGVR